MMSVKQVIPEIDKMARTVGVAGWFTPQAPEKRRALSQLFSVPLSPISGLQGVGNTPEAINRFTDTARDMTRVVDNLPERTRWQVELMLLEAENSAAVAAALKEMARSREAHEQASTKFPEQARLLLQDPKLAENLDRVQASIKMAGEVSEQIRTTVAEFREAVAEVRQTLQESQQASAAVQKASEDVHQTTLAIRGNDKTAATRPGDEHHEFRVTDVEAAADHVQTAAAEIREVIADLRREGDVPALDIGAQQADRFVTRITWSCRNSDPGSLCRRDVTHYRLETLWPAQKSVSCGPGESQRVDAGSLASPLDPAAQYRPATSAMVVGLGC